MKAEFTSRLCAGLTGGGDRPAAAAAGVVAGQRGLAVQRARRGPMASRRRRQRADSAQQLPGAPGEEGDSCSAGGDSCSNMANGSRAEQQPTSSSSRRCRTSGMVVGREVPGGGSSGVVTRLMAQRLASKARKPDAMLDLHTIYVFLAIALEHTFFLLWMARSGRGDLFFQLVTWLVLVWLIW